MAKTVSEAPPDEFQERLRKLGNLKDLLGEAFPNDFSVSLSAAEFHKSFGSFSAEELAQQKEKNQNSGENLAGRVISKRFMGKVAFVHLRDRSGTVQVYLKKDVLGPETFQLLKTLDLGDFLGVQGTPFRTKTNELTVECQLARILCKALRPLPEKWHGLQDIEQRYRQRYLDLISNERSREVFTLRSQIVHQIRQFFIEREFLEVETPMMQTLAGGAAARPFVTHHNALGMELYMRIAPELYLKRLVVGGFERVFEINRNFRNEGISTQHNPEFTMLEFYQAYATYEDLMEMTEELIGSLVKAINEKSNKKGYQLTYGERTLDFSSPWKRVTICEAIREHLKTHREAEIQNLADKDLEDLVQLKNIAQKMEISFEDNVDVGHLQMHLFEELVESTLIQPTFVTQFPVVVSPLSRRNPKNPQYVDRFELIVCGREIANAFSELNDPVDQRQRFEVQMSRRKGGDEEAMILDEDFIRALEHGMPPTAGEGIGIDRLVMLLTDSPSIREVILFPLLRLDQGK